MFYNAPAFNQPLDTSGNKWNTSNVTDMSFMFYGAINFDQTIINWNTSKVEKMTSMFSGATKFNKNISNWDTSKVTDMKEMFYGATKFNKPLDTSGNKWNTSNVTNMKAMFYNASVFNQNISNCDTSKVTDMSFIFYKATKFNQNISNWNTSNVKNMNSMFSGASEFNQPLDTSGNKWNTSNVTTMQQMFYGASAFNKNISNWDTSKVTNMSGMFYNTHAFNQPLDTSGNKWNTSNVTTMREMFSGAAKFTQYPSIGNWNFSKITDKSFHNIATYDASSNFYNFIYKTGTEESNVPTKIKNFATFLINFLMNATVINDHYLNIGYTDKSYDSSGSLVKTIVDWCKNNKNIKIALANEPPVSTKNIDILQNELVLSELKLHSNFSLDKPVNSYLTPFIIDPLHT
jgi:surface protein